MCTPPFSTEHLLNYDCFINLLIMPGCLFSWASFPFDVVLSHNKNVLNFCIYPQQRYLNSSCLTTCSTLLFGGSKILLPLSKDVEFLAVPAQGAFLSSYVQVFLATLECIMQIFLCFVPRCYFVAALFCCD